METSAEAIYSVSQASQVLGKSESSIKTYKKLVLDAFRKEPSLVTEPNGSLTEYGLEQLKKAAHFIQKGDRTGYIKAVFQANPQLEFDLDDPSQQTQAVPGNAYYTGIVKGGSIIKRRPTAITNSVADFDQGAADRELSAIETDTLRQVGSLDEVLSGFARAEFLRTVARIKNTFAAMEANALADVGATVTDTGATDGHPKPQGTPRGADAS